MSHSKVSKGAAQLWGGFLLALVCVAQVVREWDDATTLDPCAAHGLPSTRNAPEKVGSPNG